MRVIVIRWSSCNGEYNTYKGSNPLYLRPIISGYWKYGAYKKDLISMIVGVNIGDFIPEDLYKLKIWKALNEC